MKLVFKENRYGQGFASRRGPLWEKCVYVRVTHTERERERKEE